jgi:hypothetical protein
MKLPLKLQEIEGDLITNWNSRFRHRPMREGVWRRHQDPKNAALSGWTSLSDNRLRIIHYRDFYGLHGGYFALTHPYLYFATRNSLDEVDLYREKTATALSGGGWLFEHGRFEKEDLACEVAWIHDSFSIRLYPVADPPILSTVERPWKIFRQGIRDKVKRGNPRYLPPDVLCDHLPACLELGCGPAIEAGVLPLNFLHGVYSVMRPDYSFIFSAEEDRIFEFLRDPESKFRETSAIHVSCLTAKLTSFFEDVKRLVDKGLVLTPVFNNNFDGLLPSMGIPEHYLREHDSEGVYPDYDFPSEARSLIVCGSHADRRYVQKSAREKGLQIIYIDPEGYEKDGRFETYPLESPQDNDIVISCAAGNALRGLAK